MLKKTQMKKVQLENDRLVHKRIAHITTDVKPLNTKKYISQLFTAKDVFSLMVTNPQLQSRGHFHFLHNNHKIVTHGPLT